MIPVKILVRDGSWLNCTVDSIYVSGGLSFRMRVVSFAPLDQAQVGSEGMLDQIEDGAILWLLRLEIVNLSKASFLFGHVEQEMRVVDAEGYRFEPDPHIAGLTYSEYARRIGLGSFRLLPKIKVLRATIFKVSDEDTEYSLTFECGTISEA